MRDWSLLAIIFGIFGFSLHLYFTSLVFASKGISPQLTTLFTSPSIPSAIKATAQGNCKDMCWSRALSYSSLCLCIPVCSMCGFWIPKSPDMHIRWCLELPKTLKGWFSVCKIFGRIQTKFHYGRMLGSQSVSSPSATALGQHLPIALSELYN